MLPQPSTHRDINRLPRRRHVRHRRWVSLRKIVTQSITDTSNILTVKDPLNQATSFTYDSRNNILTAVNSAVSYSYTYDAANRIKSITDSRGYSLSYDYDLNGNRTKTTLQPGSADQRIISYAYDDTNRLSTLTSPAGIFSFGYNLNSQRTTLTYPNQITASYSYDDAGRLTAITHTKPDTTIITSAGYTLDDVGNRTAKSGSTAESYSYDATYRILQAITPKGYEIYSYDDVGNRTSGPGPRDTGYSHDAANRMIRGRQYSYSYDNNGNQTAKSINETKGWIQGWNFENQLSKSERTKGAEKRTVTYKYDPFGRRIEKKLETTNPATTETTSYVYDGGNIILELFTDKNGITTKTFYTHGLHTDEHLALERNNNHYYYHTDGLGSITDISDSSRTMVERYSYSVFGQPRPTTGFRNSYQFTGREWDKETGLYYYRARYYDPMEGIFISKDPIGFAGGDVNLFAYVGSNPVNWVDPWGLASFVPLNPHDGCPLGAMCLDPGNIGAPFSDDPSGVIPGRNSGPAGSAGVVGLSGVMGGAICSISKRAPIKAAKLPTQVTGKIRFVPPKNWHPSEPLMRGPRGGYLDKFGNEWTKGPSRTKGQPFEWDVQLPDGTHWNVSLDGKVTH